MSARTTLQEENENVFRHINSRPDEAKKVKEDIPKKREKKEHIFRNAIPANF